MKYSITMLALSSAMLAAFAGCSSKPSAIDQYVTESITNSNSARTAVQDGRERGVNEFVSQGSMDAVNPPSSDQLEQMLQSDSVSVRVAACKQLGSLAAGSERELEAIACLTDVLENEKSMEVRIAATNALGAMNNHRDDDELAAMVPEEELPSPSMSERISLLKRFWR